MPITSSATKALRASKRKLVYNVRRANAIDNKMRELKRLILIKDKKGAQAMIPLIQQSLDKAVKTGYIKAGAAARKKSRAVAAVKKLG